MSSGTIKHVCTKCYALDENGNCIANGGIRRDKLNIPRECLKYHPAIFMFWYNMARSMNPHFRKWEIGVLIILGVMFFFAIFMFLMVFGLIPFFTVTWT